jgi:hypothetical protein
MAEEIIPSPNLEQVPAPLESDLDRLASEVVKHRENPEMAGASDQEVVRRAIQSMSPAPAPAPTSASSGDDSALPTYMADAPAGLKLEVEDLIRIAFKEGIAKATTIAAKSNAFVLDAFHDALAGKLHDELKKRKMI